MYTCTPNVEPWHTAQVKYLRDKMIFFKYFESSLNASRFFLEKLFQLKFFFVGPHEDCYRSFLHKARIFGKNLKD